jgi:hypothetical protein
VSPDVRSDMPHPYVTRRAQISGFLGFAFLIAAVVLGSQRLHAIAILTGSCGFLLLAFAVYSQIRFGPGFTAVPKSAPWPPNSFSGWFGLVMFVVALILIGLVITLRFLHAHTI